MASPTWADQGSRPSRSDWRGSSPTFARLPAGREDCHHPADRGIVRPGQDRVRLAAAHDGYVRHDGSVGVRWKEGPRRPDVGGAADEGGRPSRAAAQHRPAADERPQVRVPYGTPPRNGWPLLAWSHGTSGVARACAPSLMTSLFYNWEGLYQYVVLGYAVVATDYAGLGTEGRHAYLDMLSNGADVINSVPAARAAVPNLSKRWLVIGHSQGGLSSLGVAQLRDSANDPHFLRT